MESPTPQEIRDLIEDAGILQINAAKLALVSLPTFTRYLSGSTTMHPYVWAVFKQIVDGQSEV